MIVHVADEQDRRPRPSPAPPAPCATAVDGLRRDDAVERAVRVALARLVIERQHDLALHVAVVVVVLQMRRADAEADEHDRRARLAARAETLRVELLAGARDGASRRSPADDVEPVALAERRRHQVVRLEIRAVRTGRLQAQALEPRPDVVGGRAVLFGVGQPAAHRVAGEEEQVGAQILLRDRFVLRRALLGRQRRHQQQKGKPDEGDVAAYGTSKATPRRTQTRTEIHGSSLGKAQIVKRRKLNQCPPFVSVSTVVAPYCPRENVCRTRFDRQRYISQMPYHTSDAARISAESPGGRLLGKYGVA